MSHYYDAHQESPLRTILIRYNELEFETPSAVFSFGKIDNGSDLLIKESIINGKVLDLGCGYGVVGISVSKEHPKNQILLSDVNERAVTFAKKNIERNHILNAKAMASKGFDKIDESFDTILLNPPQSAGKSTCFKLIEESFEHLDSQGSLQIVARHKKGGAQLSLYMKSLFGNVKVIGRGSGFKVYLSKKGSN